ncbi:MAG TPA: biopolymer transporter ExbD [Flavisolibacter sp.]|jgi:biopolymer transport protein ExbD
MAEIIPPSNRHSDKKRKHVKLNVDMTPMVDLGFLLITFFIFTTSLAEPVVTKLNMPAAGPETPVAESKSLTVILDSDRVYAYEGKWEDALRADSIIETNYHVLEGIGKLIRQKQLRLKNPDELVLIIKPLKTAKYSNVIDLLDEALINGVTRHALVEASPEEEAVADTDNR